MSAHRYWRIYITQKGTDPTFCNVSEIELRSSIGGADQTGSGTASASSFQGGGFEASKAVDNNTSTLWAFTAAINQWFKYDFGSGNDTDVVEVSLRAGGTGTQMWRGWELQYSDDDSSWTSLFTIEIDAVWSNNETRTFSASAGPSVGAANKTLWRIRSTASSDGLGFLGVSEISMRTSIGGADECSGGTAYLTNEAATATASNAFDDNNTSIATTASSLLPQWIGYKFAAAKDIVEITIRSRADSFYGQAPKDFTVEYWDGSAYQVAYTGTGETGWTSGQTRTFTFGAAPAASARPVVFITT